MLQQRPDGVLMLHLRTKTAERKEFLLACAHTVWWYKADPGQHIAAKSVQMLLMLRALREFMIRQRLHSRQIILAGDFNTLPVAGGSSSEFDDVAGYELYTGGSLSTSHLEHPAAFGWTLPTLKAPLSLRSAYQVKHGREPSETLGGSKQTMDYIFVGDGFEVVDAWVSKAQGWTPDLSHPSDHLPVGALIHLAD